MGRINIQTARAPFSGKISADQKKCRKKIFFAVNEFAPFSILDKPHDKWARKVFLLLFFFISPLSRYRSDKNRPKGDSPRDLFLEWEFPGKKTFFFFSESDRLGFCGCNDVL